MAIVWDKGYGPAISEAFKGLYGSMDRMDKLDRQEAADRWRAESQAQQRAGWDRREQDWRYQDKLKNRAEAAFEQTEIDRLRQREMLNLDKFAGIDPSTIAGGIAGQDVTIGQGAYLGQPGIDPSYSGIDEDSEEVGSALRALSPEEKMAFQAYSQATTGTDQTVFLNRQMETEAKIKQAAYLEEKRAYGLREEAAKEAARERSIADALAQQENSDENARIALGLTSGRPITDPVGLGMDDDDMGPQGQTQTTRNIGWDDIDRVYGAENWADINTKLRQMVGTAAGADRRLASAGLGAPGAIAQGIQGSVLPQTIRDQLASVYSGAPYGATEANQLGYQAPEARAPSAWDDYSVPGMVDSSTPTLTPTTTEESFAHGQRLNELEAAKDRALLGLTSEEKALADVEFAEARNVEQAKRAAGESELVNALRQQEAREGRLQAFDEQTLRETAQEQANEADMVKASANLSGDVLKIGKQILNDNSLIDTFAVAEIEAENGESEEDRAAREVELTEELRQHNATKLGGLTDSLSLQTRRIQATDGFRGLGQGDAEGFRLHANMGVRAIANKIAQNPTVRLESVDTIQLTRAFAEYMTGNWSLSELEKELKTWDIHDKAATQRDENLYQQDLNTAMNAEAKANQEIDAPRQPYVGELDIAGNMGGGAISTAMGASPAERIYNTSGGRIATGYSTPESEAALAKVRKDSAIAQVMRDRNLVGQYDAGPLSGRMSAESYRDHPEVKRTWLQRYFPFGRYN